MDFRVIGSAVGEHSMNGGVCHKLWEWRQYADRGRTFACEDCGVEISNRGSGSGMYRALYAHAKGGSCITAAANHNPTEGKG